ncbi:class F sortase [Aeromicrobium sp. Leaf350]|uniref:class F sortase n=1 Tax=Aeromicrobium sp. Leaf350 TaxID=2876565 RepID=UPI001E3695D9|nr:class F sortase [Aeromicrobium sp. Leaf350]
MAERARRAPLVAGVLAVVLGAVVVVLARPADGPAPISSFRAPNANPQGPTASASMSADDMEDGSIFIPSLDVHAPIEQVGVRAGVLEVPGDPAVVGQDERTSPLSSQEGSTFIAGHVQARGEDGALHDLPLISPGSRIYTRDDAGEGREWVVVALETSRDKVMAREHFATTGERRLTVVTCTGPLVVKQGRRSFRDSAIVTAVPAG